MNAAPPVPYFLCRTCGSREYERVVVRRRDGRPYDTAFFACMGCTTMFGDPAKYSKPLPPTKVTRVDAPISFRRSRDGSRFNSSGADSSRVDSPDGKGVATVTAIAAGRESAPRDE